MESATRYEILSKLAVGGMAEIFLARSTNAMGVQRHVVLKRIHAEFAHDQGFAQMFLDEARLASLLQHPNIAQVFDVGKLGESVFFTMEYVHGETVRTVLQHVYENNLELSLAFVLTTIAGSAAGLHHAHERLDMNGRPLGIVHRDISPANIMTTYDGTVKIVDFGVAKATTARHQTVAGTVKGKISYMSPEQCRGNVVDRRSDLFSLGIVMWELLTRGRLYRRQSDFDSMAAIVNETPVAPSAYRPGIPPEIDRLVLRLLAKLPDKRFATGEDVVDELDRVAGKLNIAMNPSAIKTALRGFFGKKPEPWLAPEATDHEPITIISEINEAMPDDRDVFSAIEVSSQPDLPMPPTLPADPMLSTNSPTMPVGFSPNRRPAPVAPRATDELLKTLQMPPIRKPPPKELDFDAATTRDIDDPDDGRFGDEDPPTMRDERSPLAPPATRTRPMQTVAEPPARPGTTSNPPSTVFVNPLLDTAPVSFDSPSIDVPRLPPVPPASAQRPAPAPPPPQRPSQPMQPSTPPSTPPSGPRPQPFGDPTQAVRALPPPAAPAEEPPRSNMALIFAIAALVIVASAIAVIVLRG